MSPLVLEVMCRISSDDLQTIDMANPVAENNDARDYGDRL